MRLTRILAVVAVSVLVVGPATNTASASPSRFEVAPIDPQRWQNQYDMTWADWTDIPGTRWNDPNARPSERGLRIALVAVDFPDQPFVITQPKESDLFGNPQIDPIPRADVPEFYRDYYMVPNELNHGRTIHEYWMEQSRGRLGVGEMDVFGAYELPRNLFEYGLNEDVDFREGLRQPTMCVMTLRVNGFTSLDGHSLVIDDQEGLPIDADGKVTVS